MNSLKLVLALLMIAPLSLLAQENTTKIGKELFNDKCVACHRFDKKLIGPSLGGISQKHNAAWLHLWMKDSNALIKTGDSLAVSIYEKYNKIPCHTYLNEKDTEKILTYIDSFPTKESVSRPLYENRIKGKKLFDNNCVACHNLEVKIIATPLKGITNKRDRKWLHAFIKDGQAMIDGGDSLAIQVYKKNEYKIPIPANPQLSEEDIDAILAYLKDDEVNDETEKN